MLWKKGINRWKSIDQIGNKLAPTMKKEILVELLQWRLDPYVDLLPETYHHPEDSDLKKKVHSHKHAVLRQSFYIIIL